MYLCSMNNGKYGLTVSSMRLFSSKKKVREYLRSNNAYFIRYWRVFKMIDNNAPKNITREFADEFNDGKKS